MDRFVQGSSCFQGGTPFSFEFGQLSHIQKGYLWHVGPANRGFWAWMPVKLHPKCTWKYLSLQGLWKWFMVALTGRMLFYQSTHATWLKSQLNLRWLASRLCRGCSSTQTQWLAIKTRSSITSLRNRDINRQRLLICFLYLWVLLDSPALKSFGSSYEPIQKIVGHVYW